MPEDATLDLRWLAGAAAFWWERLAGGYVPEEGPEPGLGGAERRAETVARWRRAVDTGRRDNLARRLAWDGLTLASVEPWLGPVRLAADAPLPAWTATLEEILEDAARAEPGQGARRDGALLDPAEPLPFEDLFVTVVATARRRLHRSQPRLDEPHPRGRSSLLAAGAWRSLERGLLRRVCELGARALHAELASTRPAGLAFLDRAVPQRAGRGETRRYRALVEAHRASGLRTLFGTYPVLARLVATAVDQWLRSTGELLERLETDLPALAETFGAGRPPGAVADLRPDLSDRHNGGRTTSILAFESGLELVYKPKDLTPDLLFQRLLGWCNEGAAPAAGLFDLRLTRILPRAGYGWVERIESRPLADGEAGRRFYTRAGQLLALVYAVQGTDCHMENLIACGEQPVLVDHETLFFPEPRLLTGDEQVKAAERLGSSVLTTGFLPQWELDEDRLAFDTSGFGGEEAADQPWWTPCWLDPNTDEMRRGRRRESAYDRHRPRLADRRLSAVDHTPAVAAGFEAAYRLLRDHRDELLAAGGPLAGLEKGAVRFLFRRTAVYLRILESVSAPETLRDGAAYSVELDLLARAFLIEEDRSHAWPVLAAEERALGEMDVPYFFHRSTDHALRWSPESGLGSGPEPGSGPGSGSGSGSGSGAGAEAEAVLPAYFERGSLERVRDGLARLDAGDLAWQVRVLETSFFTRRARKPTDRSLPPSRQSAEAGPPPLTDGEALAEAERLAEEIHATAIAERDGTTSWIGLSFAPRVERYLLENLDGQLYHGIGGIALFLAALHRVDGAERHRVLALSALRRVGRESEDPEILERVAARIGIGGVSGLASIAYAVATVSTVLEEPGLAETAGRLAAALTPERIRNDRRLDVLSGSAGALLALLAVARVAGERESSGLLERAVVCGDHLLASRVGSRGARAWPTVSSRPLTGFSHGAAGIALALARLHGATGEACFLAAAEEGIAYERGLFVEGAGNWPDLREPGSRDPSGFMTSWCHGAPGIGLARAAGLEILDTPSIRRDAEVAAETTLRFGAGTIDTVCCGTAGRVDILHTLAGRLDRPDLAAAARRLAARCVQHARRVGGYRALSNLPPAATPPGFYMGLAGVGYTLLRLARPVLPSVLSLE